MYRPLAAVAAIGLAFHEADGVMPDGPCVSLCTNRTQTIVGVQAQMNAACHKSLKRDVCFVAHPMPVAELANRLPGPCDRIASPAVPHGTEGNYTRAWNVTQSG